MRLAPPIFAVIGAGAVGLATAADLSRRNVGHVRLYDIDPARVSLLATTNTVRYDGLWGTGIATIVCATTDPAEAVRGAETVLVSTTADTHPQVAQTLAPLLEDGQNVLLHQGYVGGSLLFSRLLQQFGCKAAVHIAESMNALYLCASPGPGAVFIKGEKAWLEVTAYPATETVDMVATLAAAFPQFEAGRNSLETGLNNPNPMVHPAAYLFNLGLLAVTDQPYGQGALYFDELMTAPIQEIASQLDQERLAVITALGLQGISRPEFSQRSYPEGAVMGGAVPRFGPKLLRRFLAEDIPAGLIPIASLADLAGVATPVTRLLIDAAALVAHKDFWASGRTLTQFGLADLPLAAVVAAFVDSHHADSVNPQYTDVSMLDK